jgi:SAM-dependent methyltransferase
MRSPVTNTENVRKVISIPSKLIIEIYLKDLKIDVSRFFKADTVEIFECLDTGYKFYYPFDIVGDDKLYEDLQATGGYYSKWNWEHQMAFNQIKPTDKVLEVGCGDGGFIWRLKEANIDCCGLELNKKAVEACRKKGLAVFDELLDEHKLKHSGYYDVVCSFQVLEHICDVRSFINDTIDVVKAGGKIIFGVPNNNPFIFKRDIYHTLNMPPHHMGLWSEESFKSLENYYPFKVIDIRVEKLREVRKYLNVFLQYNNLLFLKKITDFIPAILIRPIGKIRKWKGRHLIGIYEKI